MLFDSSPRLEVSNTYPRTLMELKEFFGGAVTLKFRAEGRNRTAYRYRVSGFACVSLCKKISHLLREKRAQAELLIRLYDTPRTSETFKALVKELTDLKRINYE
jgi:hypothetical protein